MSLNIDPQVDAIFEKTLLRKQPIFQPNAHIYMGCFPSSSAKCLVNAHTKSLTFAHLFPCRFFIIYPKYFNAVLRPVN